MISEREEYEFKDGGTLTLVNGEDGDGFFKLISISLYLREI